MTKYLFFLSLLLLSINVLFAQGGKDSNGAISGTITTSDGKPASNVTIRIERSKWGGISDGKVEFITRSWRSRQHLGYV